MQTVKSIHQITLPQISDTGEESLIVFWHKSEGDFVQKGDVLVEVQTEKAVTEIESDTDGVIVTIHKKRGEVIGTGEALLSIETVDENGSKPEGLQAERPPEEAVVAPQPTQPGKFVKASPRVRKLAKDLGVDLAAITGTGKNGEPTVEDVQKAAQGPVIDETPAKQVAVNEAPVTEPVKEEAKAWIIAPPSVRKLARQVGVNLEDLQINGRIQKEDVLRFAAEKEQAQSLKPELKPTQAPAPAAASNEEIEIVRLAGIRKATAKAMSYSKRTIPHVTHFAEADVTALVAHRERFKELAKSKGIKLTFLPYVVKALISALQEFKELNASIDENEENIIYKKFYNIGIAVQTDHGLVVPVVKGANEKNIAGLAKEIDSLTKTARENKLSLAQMKGGTCTISNIGSAGGGWFTPVINHPETSILGIGEIAEKPVVKNGEIVIGKMMALSLSYDHRVIDGVIAQKALNHIKKLLQDPELLLLDLEG